MVSVRTAKGMRMPGRVMLYRTPCVTPRDTLEGQFRIAKSSTRQDYEVRNVSNG